MRCARYAPLLLLPLLLLCRSSSASAAVGDGGIHFPERIVDRPLGCKTVEGQPGHCRPILQCLTVYTQLAGLQRQPCGLRNGRLGVCCAESIRRLESGVTAAGTVSFRPPPVPVPDLKTQSFQQASQAAKAVVDRRLDLEQKLFADRVVVPQRQQTPVGDHLKLFPTSAQTLSIGSSALTNLQASIQLVVQNNLTVEQGRYALPSLPSSAVAQFANICPPLTKCPDAPSPYRAVDGSCNNLVQTDWGKADTALQRIIPPKYGDGVNSPRLAEDNGPLPSARLVSQSLTHSSNSSHQSSEWTLLLMQWGQFVDHDLTHTPLVRGQNASGITCCDNGQPIGRDRRHPDCFHIEIPIRDAFFGPFNQRCMEFVRSLPAIRPQCTFGPREQLNQVTAFLDGSVVYGSSDSAAKSLRELRSGRLSVQKRSDRADVLLPVNAEECADVLRQTFCFQAGDGRVNEQPQLATMHTIWVREHNRIVGVLERLNPRWNDERLYQEARRIVAAQIQHITFSEFLPILLGETYMSTFGLKPLATGAGYNDLYDATIDPSVTNEFATAAFRMGHSLVQGFVETFSPFGAQVKNLQLHRHQFKPFELYEKDGVETLVRGLVIQPAQGMDMAFADEVRNRLFQGPTKFGLDLIALNIQRGRDHGLPPYNDYRELCGQKRATKWEDMLDITPAAEVEKMRGIYQSVDDVDLFIGGMSELKVAGSLLGPTFLCLIGDQMARLRRGDRFFYEEGGQPSSFTLEQLNSIRKVTLARILCDNSSNMLSMQLKTFFKSDVSNQRLPCVGPSIPSLDLSLWQEK